MRWVMLLVAGAVAVLGFVYISNLPPPPISAPRTSEVRQIAFRDAVLDAKALADEGARVRIKGEYSDIGDMLFESDQSHSGGSVRLLLEHAPRDAREFLLDCGGRAKGALERCPVEVIGTFQTCFLKINKAVTFPCIAVQAVSPGG